MVYVNEGDRNPQRLLRPCNLLEDPTLRETKHSTPWLELFIGLVDPFSRLLLFRVQPLGIQPTLTGPFRRLGFDSPFGTDQAADQKGL